MAVSALLRFYRRTKQAMATHRPGSKIIAFKAIVFLNFIQGVSQALLSFRFQMSNVGLTNPHS
jgi:hypothetical protein